MANKLIIDGEVVLGSTDTASSVICKDINGNNSTVQNELDKINNDIDNNITILNNKVPFSFGVDANGNYGYIKDGADTVTPFKNFNFVLNHSITSYANTLTKSGLKKGKQYLLLMTSYSGNGGAYALSNYTVISSATGCTYKEIVGFNNGSTGANRLYILTTTDTSITIKCKADTCLWHLIE